MVEYKFYEKRWFIVATITIAVMSASFGISLGMGAIASSITNVEVEKEIIAVPEIGVSLNVAESTGTLTTLLLTPFILLMANAQVPKFRKERNKGLIPYYNGIVVFDPEDRFFKDFTFDWKSKGEWFGRLEFETSKGNIFFFKILNNKNNDTYIPVYREDFHELVKYMKNGVINGYFTERRIGRHYTSKLVRPYTTKKSTKY